MLGFNFLEFLEAELLVASPNDVVLRKALTILEGQYQCKVF